MSTGSLATAHRLFTQAVAELDAVAGSGSDAELLSLLTVCDGVSRQLDRTVVEAVAALERRGVFAERGYKSPASALSDLLGWEQPEARRRVVAAEQATARVGLDGTPLPARLPAAAAAFAAGQARLGHVEAIARVLGSASADRLTPEQWRRWIRTAPSPTTGPRRR
jgi:5-methylcytosine-specific restriction protein A